MNAPYGFRIVGATSEPRRLVNATAAFSGYCTCDDKAEVNREAYLSAFQFGNDFRQHLEQTGSTRDYGGECWSPWLWFDLDRPNIGDALHDARRLAVGLIERFALADDALLLFFSGSKGFHVGLPTSLWLPEPSTTFHKIARRFCENQATRAGIVIDTGVYDRVRAFRAPNSRHPKTGLHKRALSLDELLGLKIETIIERAAEPLAIELPTAPAFNQTAAGDWQQATAAVEQSTQAIVERKANGLPTLNRQTLEFIREGAIVGDRHRLLFSAAANLAEFGCSFDLAFALLNEAGLDAGLPPKDVRRQIECGLSAKGGGA